MRKKTPILAPLACSIAFLLGHANGIEIQKLNVLDALNVGSSWNGGVVPGAADGALFDSAISAQFNVPLGGDLSLQGIRVSNVGGTRNAATTNLTITNPSSANILSIGSGGIDMSAALQVLAIQSKLTLTASQVWNIANASTAGNSAGLSQNEDLAFLSQVAGTAVDLGGFTVTKTGAGTAAFSSGHTISNGTFNVDAGVLHFQGGGNRVTTIQDSVTFNVNAGTLRFAAQSGSGGITTQVGAPITLQAGSTLALHLNQANTINLTGNITAAGNTTWTVFGGATGGQTTFSGRLLGAGNITYANTVTEATGAGILRMSGDNSGYSGAFAINGGAAGTRSLRLTGNNAGSANATWSVAANNILQVDGVTVQLGVLNGAGSITNPNTLDAGGIEVGSGNFTGIISNGASAVLGLTKVGPGTLTLTGANTYTGATNVSGGKLFTTTAHTGATTVTIGDGATFGVTLTAAGVSYNTESITSGSISGSTIHLDASGFGNPTAPMLKTTTFNPVAPTVFNLVGSNLSSGLITLLDYAGTIGGGGFGNLSVTLPFRVGGTLVNNAANTSIDINLNSEATKWKGDVNSNWDISDGVAAGTPNWRTLTSDTATTYFQGVNTDVAVFDDTAANTSVNLTTTLTPDPGATVNNVTKTYVFTGTGKLSGPSSFTKNGAGTLILANSTPYDHTGGTFINEGTLQIGDGATPGVGFFPSGTIINNATLLFKRPDDFGGPGTFSGTGVLVKELPNTVTFDGVVNHNGPVQITAGTLRFAGGGNLSNVIQGGGSLAVQSGTLQLSGSDANTYTGLTTVNGGTLQLNKTAGTNAIAGDLLFTGTGALTLSQLNQIADTATIIYDKQTNGGTLVLNETVGALTMVNGADAGGQVNAQNGFVVTGLLSGANSSVFSVASNHSGSVGGLSLSGNTIIRIAANGNPSTLSVGALGITASGGTIQVGQGANAFDALLNLGGNVTTTGNLSFTDGGFTGAQLRRIDLGTDARAFDIAEFTTTTIAPDLAGTGGIAKSGGGTLVLTAASASVYTGGTVATAGSLLVNGSLAGTSVVDISGTALLGGTGTITPGFGASVSFFEDGKLAPALASTTGTLTFSLSGAGFMEVTGAIEKPNTQALVFDLDLPTFSDKVVITGGDLRIGAGVLEFDDFAFTPGFSFDPSASYTLFDGDTPIAGTLGPRTIGSIGGQDFALQLADGNRDLVLVSVPEPGIGTLILSAVGLLGLRRRRA